MFYKEVGLWASLWYSKVQFSRFAGFSQISVSINRVAFFVHDLGSKFSYKLCPNLSYSKKIEMSVYI